MMHAGMSYAAIERFASTLDIHPPSRTATKRREREIGPVMEKVARASSEGAVALEEALGEKMKVVGKYKEPRVGIWDGSEEAAGDLTTVDRDMVL